MEGHILSALASGGTDDTLTIDNVALPVLALLISGGHTELVLMKNWLEYELIGQTLDDAVGEAFDKVARMLGLPYPGGPHISKLAEEAEPATFEELQNGGRGDPRTFSQEASSKAIKLPRPMIHDNTCNFSFAGLKTAVLYLLKNHILINDRPDVDKDVDERMKKEIAHEFENAVTEVLWKKTERALEQTGAKTLVLGGGVSANTHIRREFTEKMKGYSDARPNDGSVGQVSLRIPAAALTTDNAIMIGLAGYYHALRKEFVAHIKANGNLSLASYPFSIL
jgi:N6-L-threonylcarbamoyladenine synthase